MLYRPLTKSWAPHFIYKRVIKVPDLKFKRDGAIYVYLNYYYDSLAGKLEGNYSREALKCWKAGEIPNEQKIEVGISFDFPSFADTGYAFNHKLQYGFYKFITDLDSGISAEIDNYIEDIYNDFISVIQDTTPQEWLEKYSDINNLPTFKRGVESWGNTRELN